MSEISCRAFSYFTTAHEHGLLDIDRLLVDLPVTRAELSDPRNRVSWDLWATLCERAVEQMEHDPARITRAGELVTETGTQGFAGFLGPIASLFASPDDIYQVVARWGGPALYRSHTFACESLPSGQLRLDVALKPGYRSCAAWFSMIPAALAVLPRFAGLPRAVIAVEHLGDRSARVLITPPRSRTLRRRVGHLWTALRAPSALTDELAFQQQQLSSALDTLRQTEGGFRAALDTLPAFVILHRDGIVVYANPVTCTALDRPIDALLGRSVNELVALEDRGRIADANASAHHDLTQIRLLRGDGTAIHVEAVTLPAFEFGGKATRGLFAIDISRQLRSEATTRLLLEALPDLLVRAGADGTLLDIHAGTSLVSHTAALRAMIGRKGAELEARIPGLGGAQIRSCRSAFEAALATGEEQRLEIDGELDRRRRFEIRVVPQDAPREVLILVRDITVQHETELRLAVAERMASVGTLAAGVAHEINNPLTYVLGGLDDLARQVAELGAQGVEVGAVRERLAEVSDGAKRVRDIVAALRSYSRVDTKTAIEQTSIRHVVERALAMCGNQLRHGARIVQRFDNAPSVLGDPTQLTQVVVNLLLNAIQALAELGRADARIEVGVGTDPRGWAVITIDDNGPGISKQAQARVFDPFFTTKPRGQGTGLGLSITQRIVSEHGGELRLDSELGKGCRFTVALPPAPKPVRAEHVSPAPAARGERILVVDDEPLVARTFARALESRGYKAQVTNSAAEALAILETTHFDLIICDLMMPEITGMELFDMVARNRPEVARRFMFATGGAFSAQARALLEHTSQPTIDKPFSAESLCRAVADALRALAAPT